MGSYSQVRVKILSNTPDETKLTMSLERICDVSFFACFTYFVDMIAWYYMVNRGKPWCFTMAYDGMIS